MNAEARARAGGAVSGPPGRRVPVAVLDAADLQDPWPSSDFEVPGAGPATTARSGRFDLVIEAAGTAAAVNPTIALARRGGRVILLAWPATA